MSKHPDPKIPPKSALLICDDLPSLEDVEVTGGQVLYVARLIRGGAGPGGCDVTLELLARCTSALWSP